MLLALGKGKNSMLRKFVIIGALGAFAAPAYAGEVYGPIEPLAAPTSEETPDAN